MKNFDQIIKLIEKEKLFTSEEVKEFKKKKEIPLYTEGYIKAFFNRELKENAKPIRITLWVKQGNKYLKRKTKLYKLEDTE